MQKLYRYTVFFSGKQQKIVIFARKFLPDKDLVKYFLRARLAGSTTFSASVGVSIDSQFERNSLVRGSSGTYPAGGWLVGWTK